MPEPPEKITKTAIINDEQLTHLIYRMRGVNVMLDSDLAKLYGVETRTLLQAVKRNSERFPDDFMFQLAAEEYELLRSQIVISKQGRGGRRYLPYVFTQEGVAMLSSVLRSSQAIQVNIEIMRAFVRLRQLIGSNEKLAKKLAALEKKYDEQFKIVFDAIRQLMITPEKEKRPIGFAPWPEDEDGHE